MPAVLAPLTAVTQNLPYFFLALAATAAITQLSMLSLAYVGMFCCIVVVEWNNIGLVVVHSVAQLHPSCPTLIFREVSHLVQR